MPPKPTGFPAEEAQLGRVPDRAADRPLSMAWMTDELIAENQRVWSQAYGRPISKAEAVEIILNIKRFAEAVLPTQRERN